MSNSSTNSCRDQNDVSYEKIDQTFSGASYKIVRFLMKPLFMLLYRPNIIGSERIPTSGPILLAGNHSHNFDPLFICVSTKRPVHFMAKCELHHGMKRHFFRIAETIPVDRRRKDNYATETAIRLLTEGKAIGIMPEGTVNRTTARLLPFKYGTVSMAKKTGALIVPFAIRGSFKPFKRDMVVLFGEPLDISQLELTEANQLLYDSVLTLMKQGERYDYNK